MNTSYRHLGQAELLQISTIQSVDIPCRCSRLGLVSWLETQSFEKVLTLSASTSGSNKFLPSLDQVKASPLFIL